MHMDKSLSNYIFLFIGLLISGLVSAQNSEEVSIEIDKGRSFGTLTIAQSEQVTPVALIIAGSGPTDRNMGKGNAYKMLSDSLLSYGISSLRYDKRTSGESVKTLTDFDDMNFDLFVDDAVAWVTFLNDDERFSDVTIIGHSQGSLVGILAAHNGSVDKFVSLAGVGEKCDAVIKKQIYDQPGNRFFFGTYIDSVFNEIANGNIVDSIPPIFQSIFNKKTQPFLTSWIQYDPAAELQKIDIPVLIIQGEMDFQVRMDQYKFLKNAKLTADTLVVPNMNHVMRYADTLDKMKNAKNYDDPNVGLVDGLMEKLVAFIKEKK